MAKHESALVDLCTIPEKDVNLESCLTAINGYDMDFDDDDMPTVDCGDDEAECMIDQLYAGWGEELGMEKQDDEAEEEEEKKKKPAPWSSRSSPSGTFVRDPKTGEMVNLDA
uniref:Uncharacterized protein n=1 Tax=Odontella aurita TaxID=265563 RepID=A0A7S4J0I1_9STRA